MVIKTFKEFLNESVHKKLPLETNIFLVDNNVLSQLYKYKGSSENLQKKFKELSKFEGIGLKDFPVDQIMSMENENCLKIKSPWDDSMLNVYAGDGVVLSNGEIYRIGAKEFLNSYTTNKNGFKGTSEEMGLKQGTNMYYKYGSANAVYCDDNTTENIISNELEIPLKEVIVGKEPIDTLAKKHNNARVLLSISDKKVGIKTVDSDTPIQYDIPVVIIKGPSNDLFTNKVNKFTKIYGETVALGNYKK